MRVIGMDAVDPDAELFTKRDMKEIYFAGLKDARWQAIQEQLNKSLEKISPKQDKTCDYCSSTLPCSDTQCPLNYCEG